MQHNLRLAGVCFGHAGERQAILSDVDLTIAKGERVCISGPSGAGKSTLVDLVLGLLRPTSGQTQVDGLDIAGASRAWQRHIGYVPQSVGLIDDSLRRNVALGAAEGEIDDRAVWRALRCAGLEDFARSLPAGLDTVFGENGARLSGGERQRVGIARALYLDPEILVLDEPTSALDLASERAVLRSVLSLGADKTVLMVAHRPSAVAMFQRVIRLEAGRVVADQVSGAGAIAMP